MVCFSDEGILVGNAAKSVGHTYITRTIYDVKRFIGLPYVSVEKDAKRVSYKVVNSIGYPKICIQDNELLPEEISCYILKYILQLANTRLETNIKKAVITVPAYFGSSQRDATMTAANSAGVVEVHIISEPTAAALAFQHDNRRDNERNLLIYDFGGGTFDVSIVKAQGKHCKVIAVGGDCHLGGIDVTMKLFQYVERDTGIPADVEVNKRLQNLCEEVKEKLSTVDKYGLEFYYKNINYVTDVNRQLFESIAEDIFQNTLRIVKDCISDAKLTKDDIDVVILVGGSTRIPRVKQMLAEYFGKEKINISRNPDQMVACGAVIYAESLLGHNDIMTFEDVLSQSLGTDVEGDEFHRIIPRNTPIPTEKRYKYATIEDYQKQMTVAIYQGESSIASQNTLLGQFVIFNLTKAPARKVIVEITFSLNTEGILKVKAVEINSNNQNELEISIDRPNLTNFHVYSDLEERKTNTGSDKKPNTEKTEHQVKKSKKPNTEKTESQKFVLNDQKLLEKKKEFDELYSYLQKTEDIPEENKIAFLRKIYRYHLQIQKFDASKLVEIDAINTEITKFIEKNKM